MMRGGIYEEGGGVYEEHTHIVHLNSFTLLNLTYTHTYDLVCTL